MFNQFLIILLFLLNEFFSQRLSRTIQTTFKIFWIFDKNAREIKFDIRDRKTDETIKNVSMKDYFMRKYNLILQWSKFLVLKTIKKSVIYLIKCFIMLEDQRYSYKLNEIQIFINLLICNAAYWSIFKKSSIWLNSRYLDLSLEKSSFIVNCNCSSETRIHSWAIMISRLISIFASIIWFCNDQNFSSSKRIKKIIIVFYSTLLF